MVKCKTWKYEKQLNLLAQRISKKKNKKIKINYQKFWIQNEMKNKKKLKKRNKIYNLSFFQTKMSSQLN